MLDWKRVIIIAISIIVIIIVIFGVYFYIRGKDKKINEIT